MFTNQSKIEALKMMNSAELAVEQKQKTICFNKTSWYIEVQVRLYTTQYGNNIQNTIFKTLFTLCVRVSGFFYQYINEIKIVLCL